MSLQNHQKRRMMISQQISLYRIFTFLFIILLVLELLDFALTLHLISVRRMEEANPIIKASLHRGQYALILFDKILFSLLIFIFGIILVSKRYFEKYRWFLQLYVTSFIFCIFILLFAVLNLGWLYWS